MNFAIDREFRALIPPLSTEELAQLESNIVAFGGARDPLVVWNGTLLDGHNRYEICKRRKLPFPTCEPKEKLADRDSAKLWIIRNQLGRRNLPPYERVRLEDAKATLLREMARLRQAHGTTAPGRGVRAETLSVNSQKAIDTTAEVARAAGVGEQLVSRVRVIESKAPEPVKRMLRDQRMSIDSAYQTTKALDRLSAPVREAVIAKMASDISDIEAKKLIGEIKLEAKRALAEEIRANPVVTPDGRYQVIVSDPPWKYDTRAEDTTHRGKNLYPEMTVEQICALPVSKLAQDDCVLWLWTTNAFMRDAYRCLDAWGFTEKTILTWDKEILGLGDWLRNVTEHCILAVRGRPIVSLTNQTTIIREKRREHSRKPESFYALVDALCPGSKLEMFARATREGWASWGAESKKFDVCA